MKLTVTFEIDDALIELRRRLYALRLSTATTLETMRDAPTVTTIAQWDAAKKAAQQAYSDWSEADHQLRVNATERAAKSSFFAQLDAFLAELPEANPDKDPLIPARKET